VLGALHGPSTGADELGQSNAALAGDGGDRGRSRREPDRLVTLLKLAAGRVPRGDPDDGDVDGASGRHVEGASPYGAGEIERRTVHDVHEARALVSVWHLAEVDGHRRHLRLRERELANVRDRVDRVGDGDRVRHPKGKRAHRATVAGELPFEPIDFETTHAGFHERRVPSGEASTEELERLAARFARADRKLEGEHAAHLHGSHEMRGATARARLADVADLLRGLEELRIELAHEGDGDEPHLVQRGVAADGQKRREIGVGADEHVVDGHTHEPEVDGCRIDARGAARLRYGSRALRGDRGPRAVAAPLPHEATAVREAARRVEDELVRHLAERRGRLQQPLRAPAGVGPKARARIDGVHAEHGRTTGAAGRHDGERDPREHHRCPAHHGRHCTTARRARRSAGSGPSSPKNREEPSQVIGTSIDGGPSSGR
jgi:hypothetical protein